MRRVCVGGEGKVRCSERGRFIWEKVCLPRGQHCSIVKVVERKREWWEEDRFRAELGEVEMAVVVG